MPRRTPRDKAKECAASAWSTVYRRHAGIFNAPIELARNSRAGSVRVSFMRLKINTPLRRNERGFVTKWKHKNVWTDYLFTVMPSYHLRVARHGIGVVDGLFVLWASKPEPSDAYPNSLVFKVRAAEPQIVYHPSAAAPVTKSKVIDGYVATIGGVAGFSKRSPKTAINVASRRLAAAWAGRVDGTRDAR